MADNKGWVCPKCGRVYAPFMPDCPPCNSNVPLFSTTPAAGGRT